MANTSLDPMHDWKLLAGYGNNSVGAGGSGYTGNQLTDFSDKLLDLNLRTDAPWTPKTPTPDPSASGLGKYLNKDFLGGVGSAMEGLGSLASGWAALKNLKLSRQAMENQQNQWQTNFDAQGRTDYGAYVGGKPAGSNYVG
jgi:hypothetical protein